MLVIASAGGIKKVSIIFGDATIAPATAALRSNLPKNSFLVSCPEHDVLSAPVIPSLASRVISFFLFSGLGPSTCNQDDNSAYARILQIQICPSALCLHPFKGSELPMSMMIVEFHNPRALPTAIPAPCVMFQHKVHRPNISNAVDDVVKRVCSIAKFPCDRSGWSQRKSPICFIRNNDNVTIWKQRCSGGRVF